MKGKYITTQIRIASLSGKKNERIQGVAKESLADTTKFKTIWTKDRMEREELLYRLVF